MARVYKRPGSPFWWARYTTPDGELVRRSTRCRDRGPAARLAREWERAAEHDAADAAAGIQRPKALQLVHLAALFIGGAVDLAASTRKSYEDRLRVHAIPYFGADSDVATWTRQHIEGWRRSMLNGTSPSNRKVRACGESRWAAWRFRRRLKRRRPPRLMTAATANRNVTAVSAMLQWAVGNNRLPANVCRGIPALKERNAVRHRALSDLEIESLAGALDEECAEWVGYMIETGMRYTEAQSIRIEDHDLARRAATVRASTSKSAMTRHVPLTRAAVEIVERIRDRRDLKRGALFAVRDRRRLLDVAWKATGLAGRCPSPHDFRHTCASRCAAAGMDLVQLLAWFGWKTPAVAARYLHLYAGRWDDMLKKLDRA